MNHAQAVIDIYRALHAAAPGSDAGKRFIRDMGAWAVFSLLARLCRVERPSPATERDLLGLASIAGIAYRCDSSSWLEQQVERAANTLASPTVREQAADAEDAFATGLLDETDLTKAAQMRSRGAVTMAARNAAALPSATKEFHAYMQASGAFTRGAPLMSAFGSDLAQRFVDKAVKSVQGLPAAEYAFGSKTAAAEIRAWLRTGALDVLLGSYEPAFDDSWLAANEIASLEAEEEGNFARHESELRAIRDEVQARTDGYRAQFGT